MKPPFPFIDGYPGKFVVIARKAKGVWYVAGINGDPGEKQIALRLPFLSARTGRFIHDGKDNRSFESEETKLDDSKSISISVKGNGGFIMVFEENGSEK